MTPLHYASAISWDKRFIEVLEALLAKGADVNAKDDLGQTPLDYTVTENNMREAGNLLQEHGGQYGLYAGQ
jgi:ankyrin repeat protein